MKVVVLIPAYNSSNTLVSYIDDLIKKGLKDIIVVNDGSKDDDVFKLLKDKCILINHEVNKGKGCALKTGLKYYLNNYKDYAGVVTADDDNQHSVEDVYNISNCLEKNKDFLILGVRDFNEKQVPFRSKYGNKITSIIFNRLYHKYISDTQTGLRGLPNKFIKKCTSIEGDGFDYETNMLISAVRENINIIEEKIKTIYIDNNKKTRFNGVSDSVKIYKILFKNK